MKKIRISFLISFALISFLYGTTIFINSNNSDKLNALSNFTPIIISTILVICQIIQSKKISLSTEEFSQKRLGIISLGHRLNGLVKEFNDSTLSFKLIDFGYKNISDENISMQEKKSYGIVSNRDSTISFTYSFFGKLRIFKSTCCDILYDLSVNSVSDTNEITTDLNSIINNLDDVLSEEESIINSTNKIIDSIQNQEVLTISCKKEINLVIDGIKPINNIIELLNSLTNNLDKKINKAIEELK